MFIFAIYLRANFNEKMKNEPLIYGNNTMQINGKFLYFKELQENPKLLPNLNPLKLVDIQSSLIKKDLSKTDTYHRFKGDLKISGVA